MRGEIANKKKYITVCITFEGHFYLKSLFNYTKAE